MELSIKSDKSIYLRKSNYHHKWIIVMESKRKPSFLRFSNYYGICRIQRSAKTLIHHGLHYHIKNCFLAAIFVYRFYQPTFTVLHSLLSNASYIVVFIALAMLAPFSKSVDLFSPLIRPHERH